MYATMLRNRLKQRKDGGHLGGLKVVSALYNPNLVLVLAVFSTSILE